MAAETPDLEGPSDHAVRLARMWLVIGGWVWLVGGIAMVHASGFDPWWVPTIMVSVAIAHFVVARFGSRRIAVFFVMFAP
jgi:hypothetical protein